MNDEERKLFAKNVANWLNNDLRAIFKKYKIKMGECPVTARDLAFIIYGVQLGIITRQIGRKIIENIILGVK
jgi:Asp-tRNA(Asn)/Glu-tRNA(Gln) amidotransferase B subunit